MRELFFRNSERYFLKVVLVRLFQRILFKTGHFNLIVKASAHRVDLTSSPMHKTYSVGARYIMKEWKNRVLI